jgi:hypothetical protein
MIILGELVGSEEKRKKGKMKKRKEKKKGKKERKKEGSNLEALKGGNKHTQRWRLARRSRAHRLSRTLCR